MKKRTIIAAVAVTALAGLVLTGCEAQETPKRDKQLSESQQQFDKRTPPKVSGDTEYNNYIKAQELYDDPTNILWCTASFPSDASPLFTVPVAGKLTSSTVSYYPSTTEHFDSEGGNYATENQSVDGMYHGNAVPYRYGFTPGGQYVDFTDLSVFCTTALTSFQRQNLGVTVSPSAADAATKQAEAQLKAGDKAGAQKTLDNIAPKK